MDREIPGLHHVTAIAEILRNAGADVTIRFFQAGHELTPDDVDLARECLSDLN